MLPKDRTLAVRLPRSAGNRFVGYLALYIAPT